MRLDPSHFVVRPFFRVLAALLLAFMAYVFIQQGIHVWGAAAIAPEQCRPGKGRLLCELGNLVLNITPAASHGPLAGMARFGFAALLIVALWWIVKPLFKLR